MTGKKGIYPWVVVALLWVVALFNYMDRQMLSTMQSAMKADILELGKAEAFGALMAVFLWVYCFMSPVAGVITDRLNRKWLVVASLFVWSSVTFLMGYATTFDELYVLRAFMGISEALYIPCALSLIADWHTDRTRSLAIGIHMTGLYTGQAIGGFGATVASMFSWHAAFQIFGVVGIVYALVLMLALKENPSHSIPVDATAKASRSSVLSGIPVVLGNWAFWIILLYFAIPSLPGWATKNWLPTLFSESLGISMSEAGPMSTITIAISSFIGVIAGGFLSDRWIERNIRGRIYTSAIGLGMTIPSLLLLGFGDSVISLVLAGALFGLGYGIFDANNMPILCQFISPRYRGTAYGIMNMTGVCFGALVTQVLGTWTDEGGLGLGFAYMSAVVLAVLLLQLIFLRPASRSVQ